MIEMPQNYAINILDYDTCHLKSLVVSYKATNPNCSIILIFMNLRKTCWAKINGHDELKTWS